MRQDILHKQASRVITGSKKHIAHIISGGLNPVISWLYMEGVKYSNEMLIDKMLQSTSCRLPRRPPSKALQGTVEAETQCNESIMPPLHGIQCAQAIILTES